jgi:hypothetical protein
VKKYLAPLKTGLVAGFAGFLLLSPVLAQAQLSVTIGEGSEVRSSSRTFTFGPNTAVATGGSGSYSFVWTNTNDGLGRWTGGAGQSFSPQATISVDCNVSSAVYTATVTDMVTGAKAASNTATYTYEFFESGVDCP